MKLTFYKHSTYHAQKIYKHYHKSFKKIYIILNNTIKKKKYPKSIPHNINAFSLPLHRQRTKITSLLTPSLHSKAPNTHFPETYIHSHAYAHTYIPTALTFLIDLVTAAPSEERRFFSFHEWGISVYEPSACRLYHQIKSTDIIPGTQVSSARVNIAVTLMQIGQFALEREGRRNAVYLYTRGREFRRNWTWLSRE